MKAILGVGYKPLPRLNQIPPGARRAGWAAREERRPELHDAADCRRRTMKPRSDRRLARPRPADWLALSGPSGGTHVPTVVIRPASVSNQVSTVCPNAVVATRTISATVAMSSPYST